MFKNLFFVTGKVGYIIYPFLRIVSKIIRTLKTGYVSVRTYHFPLSSAIDFPYCSLKGLEYVYIGEKTNLGKYISLNAWYIDKKPEIIIKNNVSIGSYAHITATNKIEIGNNVLTGLHVTITDNSHGTNDSLEELSQPPLLRKSSSKGSVTIKDNVWIGDKVTICPNVTIGEGSVIGANSVVTKDVPPYSIVAGSPAKIIKQFK